MTILKIKIFFVLLIPLCVLSQTPKFPEYEVKAAFLEKFTRFIEWPDEVHMDDMNKSFVIAIICDNPFKSILEDMYSKQTIKGKKVDVRYISTLDDIDKCNLLFVSKSENDSLSQILFHIKEKPILTVGDDKRFAKKGIIITFFVESNHIRFEINKNAAEESGLYISSLLLNLSASAKTEEN